MQRRSSRWRERETETREDSYREWRHCGSTFQKELFAAPYHYTTIKHNHNVLICPENNNRPTTSAYLSMPRLSLFGIHSLSQTCKHRHTHTHTSLSFILKLDADLSYPPPTILSLQLPQALFPALPLSSPRFPSQH